MPAVRFNPFDPEIIACPYPTYASLRATEPIHRLEDDLYFITRYEDVVNVLSDPLTFSSREANRPLEDNAADPRAQEILAGTYPLVPALLTADPPAHNRHRRIVQAAFSGRRIAQLSEVIEERATRLVNQFLGRGRVELVGEFARPLPLQMIADALGASWDDLPRFKAWSDSVLARIGRSLTGEEQVQVATHQAEMQTYLLERIKERRTEPHDDFLSDVVRAGSEDEEPLSLPEMITILEQVLVAGNETTTRLIVMTMWFLARDDALMGRVRAQRNLVPPLLEEVLRLESPVQIKLRVATRKVVLGHITIPAGSRIMLGLGAANHDPGKFPQPVQLECTRENVRKHVAFGFGPHFCVGANLARAEARIAVGILLDRLGNMKLGDPPPDFEPSLVHRGIDQLNLTFEPISP
jgi:cytochrome P450